MGVGFTKMSTEEIRKVNKDVALETIFFLNDGIWQVTKEWLIKINSNFNIIKIIQKIFCIGLLKTVFLKEMLVNLLVITCWNFNCFGLYSGTEGHLLFLLEPNYSSPISLYCIEGWFLWILSLLLYLRDSSNTGDPWLLRIYIKEFYFVT